MIRPIIFAIACLFISSSPAFAWVISAGFEGGVLGTTAQSPNPDAFLDLAGDSKYVDSPVLTGSQAGSVSINQGETAFGTWGGGFGFPSDLGEGDELWFRINVYYPEGWNFSCDGCTEGMKFMRIHTKAADGSNEGYQQIFLKGGATGGLLNAGTEVNPSAFFTNNGPWPYTAARDLGDPIPRDQWQTYEMYLKFSSVENEGIYRVWQDENLIFEDLQTPTLRSATSVADLVYLYTYWNNGAPQTQTSYVDDILITNETPNKVDEFGNPMIGAPALAPTLDGDFDQDGDADGADFLLWQRDMSIGSLLDWQADYGDAAALSSAVGVPEPSTAVLFGASALLASMLASRRQACGYRVSSRRSSPLSTNSAPLARGFFR